ncbi:MAG: bifunctional 5,10-methylenetetrahydrofolate dehydrogenase/5,10-methenyltetrahydrofolate cyclohydrolase [bacterium]
MEQLIKGKPIATKIKEKTALEVEKLKKAGIHPKLAVVLVGDDKPSQIYVRKKKQAAEKAGIEFVMLEIEEKISQDELISKIIEIQKDDNICGLIVQLPLPEHLYTPAVLNAIDPKIDVDCLTDINLGKLVMKTNFMVPPTPGAVMTILKELGVDLPGKNATILGMGALVGKPLAIMLMNERCSVTVCNSATRDTAEKCLNADIIVSGVGKKDLVRGNMVSPRTIVIDTGICFENNQMYGDVNVEEIAQAGAFVTPTPSGVGPITVARLLWNTILCAKKIHNLKN